MPPFGRSEVVGVLVGEIYIVYTKEWSDQIKWMAGSMYGQSRSIKYCAFFD